jgi:hypothetical protein
MNIQKKTPAQAGVFENYLGCAASTGQTLAQAPQSMQDASSTT